VGGRVGVWEGGGGCAECLRKGKPWKRIAG
jgi:hypothetical protein